MHPRSLVLMLARVTAVLLASLVGASYATAQEDVRNPRPERLTSVMLVPEGLKWEPEHAAPDQSQIAIFHVDQKTGATELYFRLPPHFHAVRHWHSANETNVVVRGTFIIQHDGGERMTMIAGNSSVMPRRMVHQAWSEGEETIVYVSLDGPWDYHAAKDSLPTSNLPHGDSTAHAPAQAGAPAGMDPSAHRLGNSGRVFDDFGFLARIR